MQTGDPAARPRGFAYLFLLVAVALLAAVAASAVKTGALLARRSAEDQLLAVGAEFSLALESYAKATPAGRPPAPRMLEELLADQRFPGVLRHLRQVYADPLTGQRDWGLLQDPNGFIVGVYSMAPGVPVKQQGFGDLNAHMQDAQTYAAWVFSRPCLRLQGAGRCTGQP
jgi:type II secretory pathway pseudopilin PulG